MEDDDLDTENNGHTTGGFESPLFYYVQRTGMRALDSSTLLIVLISLDDFGRCLIR